jgi:hypothetical protein
MTQLQLWLGNSPIHDHIGWSSMAIEAPNHSPGGQSFTAMEVNLHVTQFTASMEDLHKVGPPWTWRLTFMSPLLRTSLKGLHITPAHSLRVRTSRGQSSTAMEVKVGPHGTQPTASKGPSRRPWAR